MIRKRSVLFIILIIFFSIEVSSCSTERSVLINSLPNDNSWFTRAKRIALTDGKKEDVLGYIWDSKTIYINQEKVYYSIVYTPTKYIKVPWSNKVSLSKTHGSLSRSITFFEDRNLYTLLDRDFLQTIESKNITKEEAEEFAYNFFKELDKYNLRYR